MQYNEEELTNRKELLNELMTKLKEMTDKKDGTNTQIGVYLLVLEPSMMGYVGSTDRKDARIREHLSRLENGSHENVKLQKIFSGESTWTFYFFPTQNERKAEIEEIILAGYITKGILLNISESFRGGWYGEHHPDKEGILRKMSESAKARPSNRKGIKYTPEQSANLSARMKGSKMHENTREALLKANTGHVTSEETKQKISDKLKGRVSPTLGLKRTEESKQRISEIIAEQRGIKVIIDGVKYNGYEVAGRALGVTRKVVTTRVKSNKPQWSEWKFVEEEDKE